MKVGFVAPHYGESRSWFQHMASTNMIFLSMKRLVAVPRGGRSTARIGGHAHFQAPSDSPSDACARRRASTRWPNT